MIAKIQPIATKLRFAFSGTFWRTMVFTKIRVFFTKLLNVKPRNKKDYYPMGRWLVSKRLAFALLVAFGVICALYISKNIPAKNTSATKAIPVYHYNSTALKFKKGEVSILARDGHLAYTGAVSKGAVNGAGVLYTKKGTKLYEGDFVSNQYSGTGKLYYPDGSLQYEGEFAQNLFQGKGKYYFQSGAMQYDGEYLSGRRNGAGILYNSAASKIFTGNFRDDEIVYSDLLDKSTSDVSSMYSGSTSVYSTADEYCVTLDEIGAAYAATNGETSLDGNWKVQQLYVLSGKLTIGGEDYKTVAAVKKALGAPDYFGDAYVDLPEAVCINKLISGGNEELESVNISSTSELDGVYTVGAYDRNRTVYIYSFVKDGLVYTLYCASKNAQTFLMYAIRVA